jgi:hypothetical protein
MSIDYKNLEYHELCLRYRVLTTTEYQALINDLKKNNLPIWLTQAAQLQREAGGRDWRHPAWRRL